MIELGLCGVTRTKKVRTTTPAPDSQPRPTSSTRLQRQCARPPLGGRPDLRLDESRILLRGLRHRRLQPPHPGWRVSSSLRTDLALDALEMAIFTRGARDTCGDDPHLDPGAYLASVTPSAWRTLARSTRWTRRATATKTRLPRPSTGSPRPSSSTDVGPGVASSRSRSPRPSGSTGGIPQRLHSACGDVPPAEYEAAYWANQQVGHGGLNPCDTRVSTKPRALHGADRSLGSCPGSTSGHARGLAATRRKTAGCQRGGGCSRLTDVPMYEFKGARGLCVRHAFVAGRRKTHERPGRT